MMKKTNRSPLFSRIKLLALGAALCCAPLSMAAEDVMTQGVTVAHVRELLQLNRVPQFIEHERDNIERKSIESFNKETDPKLKAHAAEKTAFFSKTLRQFMSWESLEPVAVEVYQKTLRDIDAVEIIDYYKSPNGKLWSAKMAPVIEKLQPEITAYIERQAADTYRHLKDGTPVTPQPAAKPYTEKEKRALALLKEMGLKTVRSYFELKVTYMEKTVAPIVLADKTPSKPAPEAIRELADTLRHNITYENIEPLAVKALATLSDADIATLTEDSKPLERKYQFAQLEKLERLLSANINAVMQREFVPALQKGFAEIEPPPAAASAPAAAASAPATADASKPASSK